MDSPAGPPSEQLIDSLLFSLTHKAGYLQLTEEEATGFLFPSGAVSGWKVTAAEIQRIGSRDDWEALQARLNKEMNDRHLDFLRSYFSEKVRTTIVEGWIQENLVDGTDFDKDALKRDVEFYLKDGRQTELRAYLLDVLDGGVKKAQKKRKRPSGGYFGHAWQGAQGVIRLAIVVGIFGAAQSKFEMIVFASLVLIYELISSVASGQAHFMLASWFEIQNHFRRVRRLLKEEPTPTEAEIQYERDQADFRTGKREVIRFWINTGSSFIIWLVAVWKLISAVF